MIVILVCPYCKGIGNDNLLEAADKKEEQTMDEVPVLQQLILQSVELRHHLLMGVNRPCQKM
jgi:uncharacterized protein YbaR (Trm112 family)